MIESLVRATMSLVRDCEGGIEASSRTARDAIIRGQCRV